MKSTNFGEQKQVLIFNNRKLLVMIAASVNVASKFSGLKPGNISRVCNGSSISLGMYYFRYVPEGIQMSLDDLGVLKLTEFDDACGVKRVVYSSTKMNREGWNYEKRKAEAEKSILNKNKKEDKK